MTGASADKPLLSVRGLKVHFPVKRHALGKPHGVVKAVDDISFDIHEGETLALVGESGCGKSTTGNAILGLASVSQGNILFDGVDIARMRKHERRAVWRDVQVVFQDPVSALNPKRTIGKSIAEPLAINSYPRKQREARVSDLLEMVGLSKTYRDRYPNELSGGQRQRVVIARALALEPKLIICDEPVSALDVSIQSQILNLLMRLQRELRLSYLFISHDLSVVRHIADRVFVMYLGTIVEEGGVDRLFDSPVHPYTKALLSAIPLPDPELERAKPQIILEGEIPDALDPPAGCPFVTRCPIREQQCTGVRPALARVEGDHKAACPVAIR